MIKKAILLITLLITISTGTAYAQSLSNTFFITETLPPYNYAENGTLKGISVSILKEALNAVGIQLSKYNIVLYPWARGFKTTLATPNTCLFSTARNEARENQFKWAGPMLNATQIFISLSDTKTANNIEELKNHMVSTHRQGIGHYILKEKNFSKENIDLSSSTRTLFEKLRRKRVKFILENEYVISHYINGIDINWSALKKHHVVDIGELYFAFNKDTEDHVVAKLQKGIDIIRKNGTLAKILSTMPEE